MVTRQINENRLDIDPKLGEALVNYNMSNTLEKSLKEEYLVVHSYFEKFPDLRRPPCAERVEEVLEAIKE